MTKYVCSCGHVIRTDGSDYRSPCPKCGNQYLTRILDPRDVMVVHSETKIPQQNEV